MSDPAVEVVVDVDTSGMDAALEAIRVVLERARARGWTPPLAPYGATPYGGGPEPLTPATTQEAPSA